MSDLTPKQTLHGSISTGGSANPLRGNVMTRGLDGKSAYDYAVSKGYEGTEEEFAEKLKELADGEQGVSSWNDLEDKPFGEIVEKQMIIEPTEHTFIGTINEDWGTVEDYENLEIDGSDYADTWVDGEQIYVMWNGVEYVVEPYNNKGRYVLYIGEPRIARIILPSSSSTNFYISPEIIDNSVKELPVTFSIYRKSTTLKQLDEKFIPDTIARKSDIPEQSDALYLISELGLAGGEVIADDNGNVFTDENGVIYVI